MNKWRPPDWEKRRAEAIRKVVLDLQHNKEAAFVEAGADAMLEGLLNGVKLPVKANVDNYIESWRIGDEATFSSPPIIEDRFQVGQDGYMVFIPGDMEEK